MNDQRLFYAFLIQGVYMAASFGGLLWYLVIKPIRADMRQRRKAAAPGANVQNKVNAITGGELAALDAELSDVQRLQKEMDVFFYAHTYLDGWLSVRGLYECVSEKHNPIFSGWDDLKYRHIGKSFIEATLNAYDIEAGGSPILIATGDNKTLYAVAVVYKNGQKTRRLISLFDLSGAYREQNAPKSIKKASYAAPLGVLPDVEETENGPASVLNGAGLVPA